MKTIIRVFYFITIIFLISSCSRDENDEPQTECDFVNFKYYNNEQDLLGEMSEEYIVIASDTINNNDLISSLIQSKEYLDQDYEYVINQQSSYKYKYIALKLISEKNCIEITNIISDLEQSNIIDYVHFAMQTDDCTNLIWEEIGEKCINSYSSVFYVKVIDENDLTDLNNIIQETNTVLDHQNQFMPKWFTLSADKNSNGDALQMANYFYETNLFQHSEPNVTKIPVEF